MTTNSKLQNLNLLVKKINNFFTSNCFTNVYGLARAFLAFGLLSTFLFNTNEILFDKDLFGVDTMNSFTDKINLFFILGYEYIWLSEIIAIIILMGVIIGYLPFITGILHWWIAFSFYNSAALIDGGDQIAMILVFFLIPVTLFDRRLNHYHKPIEQNQVGKYISSLILKIIIPLQMATVYIHAFSDKIYKVEEWRNGTAVYYFSKDPLFGSGIIESVNLFSYAPFVIAATWGTMFLELILGGAIFMSYKNKKWMLPLAIMFHFSIWLMFGLWSFMFSMIGGLIIYLILPEKSFNFNFITDNKLGQPKLIPVLSTFIIISMIIFGLYNNIISYIDASCISFILVAFLIYFFVKIPKAVKPVLNMN